MKIYSFDLRMCGGFVLEEGAPAAVCHRSPGGAVIPALCLNAGFIRHAEDGHLVRDIIFLPAHPDSSKSAGVHRQRPLRRVSLEYYPTLRDDAPALSGGWRWGEWLLVDERSHDRNYALVVLGLTPPIGVHDVVDDHEVFLLERWDGERFTSFETLRGTVEDVAVLPVTKRVHIHAPNHDPRPTIGTRTCLGGGCEEPRYEHYRIVDDFPVSWTSKIVRLFPDTALRVNCASPLRGSGYIITCDSSGAVSAEPDFVRTFFTPRASPFDPQPGVEAPDWIKDL